MLEGDAMEKKKKKVEQREGIRIEERIDLQI